MLTKTKPNTSHPQETLHEHFHFEQSSNSQARPVGFADSRQLTTSREPVRELADGEISVKTLYISIDPAMRGWMNGGKSYIRPLEINEVMRAGGVGRVVASSQTKFKVGDIVSGSTGVQGILDRCSR